MEYHTLHKNGLRISALILGTWAIGGEMWGGTDENQAVNAIQAAADTGINTIDTAPVYGDGLAEMIIGKAIKGKREQWILATKCGLVRSGKRIVLCLRAESVMAEAEQSLRRLGTDHLDVYQCHWPDPQTPIESTMEALNRLKKQGKIKAIGLSNFDLPLIKRAAAVAEITVLQNQYSLLERTIENELLPYAQESGLAVVTYGALAGGILTGKYHAPPHFPKADARSFFYKYYQGDIFKTVTSRCQKLGAGPHPINELAINWVRQQPGITAVIVGCRSAQQVEKNARALTWQLDPAALKSVGTVFEDVRG